jgi:hypothetical protein
MARAIVFLALALASGCDLSDELEGEPCGSARDCWHKQECARTDAEAQAGLPGVCAEAGTGCLEGQQLGCACDPEDASLDCSFPAVPSATEYPVMMCEPMQRLCVLAPQEPATEG